MNKRQRASKLVKRQKHQRDQSAKLSASLSESVEATNDDSNEVMEQMNKRGYLPTPFKRWRRMTKREKEMHG
jgi:primosomal protein N'